MNSAASMVNDDIPAHVPPALVADLDIYAPHRAGEDYFAAWLRWRESMPHPVVWTPRNGGHWVAMRGPGVLDVLSDSERFSVDAFGVPRAPERAQRDAEARAVASLALAGAGLPEVVDRRREIARVDREHADPA